MAHFAKNLLEPKAIKEAVRELNREMRNLQKELAQIEVKRNALLAILRSKLGRSGEFSRNGIHDTIFKILKKHPRGMTTAEITTEIIKIGATESRTPSGTVYVALIRHPNLFVKGAGRKWFCKK